MNSQQLFTCRGIALTVATALLAFSPGAALAASISWSFSEIVNIGGAQSETGTGFLASDGDLVFAENSGGVALTHDGIDFAAGTFSLGSEASAFHADAPLTDTATFGGPNGPPVVVTIGAGAGELGGVALVPGQEYRLQLIIMDGRGNQAGRSIEIDGNSTDHVWVFRVQHGVMPFWQPERLLPMAQRSLTSPD